MKQISKHKNSLSIYFIFSIAFFVLLCLAIWQLNKHYQKTERKNLIDLKFTQEPKYISNLNLNFKSLEIIKVKAEILEDKSLFFEPRTYKGKVGYHKLTPLKVEDKYVLVNRGFTTQKKSDTLSIKYIHSSFKHFKFPYQNLQNPQKSRSERLAQQCHEHARFLSDQGPRCVLLW